MIPLSQNLIHHFTRLLERERTDTDPERQNLNRLVKGTTGNKREDKISKWKQVKEEEKWRKRSHLDFVRISNDAQRFVHVWPLRSILNQNHLHASALLKHKHINMGDKRNCRLMQQKK